MPRNDYERSQKQLSSGAGKPINLPLSCILLDPHQPRKVIDDEEFAELVASIKENGQKVPIQVSPGNIKNGIQQYYIDFGERRFRTHQFLGLTTIKANVSTVTYSGVLDINRIMSQAMENMNRAQQSHSDITRLYRLFQEDVLSKNPKIQVSTIQVNFSSKFGKKFYWAKNYATLVDLIPEYLSRVDTKDEDKKIPFLVAVAVARAPQELQKNCFEECEKLAKGDKNRLRTLVENKIRAERESRGERIRGKKTDDTVKLLRVAVRMLSFMEAIVLDDNGNPASEKTIELIRNMRGIQVDEFLRFIKPVNILLREFEDIAEKRKTYLEENISVRVGRRI